MRIKNSVMSQLEDFQAWVGSGPISLLDYVGFVATPDSLFGFAELFMPELVTHGGYRFLGSGFSEDVYQAWAQKGLCPTEIQRIMNHVHISMLFQGQEVSDETANEAARVISAVWSRTLGAKGLIVAVIGSTFTDAAVTFCEKHTPPV